MINILVVEDDQIQRENLAKMLCEIKKDFTILEASTVEEALKIVNMNTIHLFYIDICLGEGSGINLAFEIRKSSKYKLVWIVFITTHVSYIIEAFKKIHCYDYIIKPYDKENIKDITLTLLESQTINSVNESIEKKYVTFEIDGIWLEIAMDEIVFAEVFARTCYVHTKNQIYKIDYTPLKKIIELLQDGNFIQCHRSYVVNIDYIKKIEKNGTMWEVMFYGYEGFVTVGKNHKKEMEKIFLASI